MFCRACGARWGAERLNAKTTRRLDELEYLAGRGRQVLAQFDYDRASIQLQDPEHFMELEDMTRTLQVLLDNIERKIRRLQSVVPLVPESLTEEEINSVLNSGNTTCPLCRVAGPFTPCAVP